ncbi:MULTISPECIES: hypothetical protein [unclassified Mycoplasma]|uniref:hypothetical protein n=1 Tax=unclassified Mycoplasma TaxID=2683645 RepID=UPI00211BED29|nr:MULTISPECIES: hypothetical protein [unclassified Mycoplasma]UUM19517.1 hypothetical protein NPA11_01910 [Mycoplasma sp. 1578d]UUM24437.1 hypothetical protein NPA12_01885 [Mycoplasma sp. 3686d]
MKILKILKNYLKIRKQRAYFYFWKNRLSFTLEKFTQMGLIKKALPEDWITFDGQKWNNLDHFVEQFNFNLSFPEYVTEQDREMIKNFYVFFFYQLAWKTNHKKIKIVFLKRQPYLKKDKCSVNHFKRIHYYKFLDRFKQFEDYNVILLEVLRKIL